MEKKNQEITLNNYSIILLGDSMVGKSSLIRSYMEKVFLDKHISTFPIDYHKVSYERKGCQISIKVFDPMGIKRVIQVSKQFIKKVNGVIFVYSVNDRESFNSINKWLCLCEDVHTFSNIKMAIFGNKNDCYNREVSYEEGRVFADKLGIPFFEVSAMTREGIQQSFDYVFDKIIGLVLTKYYPLKWIKLKNGKKAYLNSCNS